MVCDKCGFEHNSKSVCPKCGARVVYVNEDYLRRKKEWEEAQKNGQKSAPLPGITYSTREDYDRKKGHDTVGRVNDRTEDGRHEDAGLPFDEIKEWAKKMRGRFAALFGRRRGRRGADNPVIREIKFNSDGEPENPDDIELVKIRRRSGKRVKPAFIAAAVIAGTVLLLAVGAAIVLNRSDGKDSGGVFIFDGKNGFYADNEGGTLIEDAGENFTVAAVFGSSFIAYDDGAVYICQNGKVSETKAVFPRIIAYNGGADLVVFETGGRTHILSGGKDIELDLEKKGDFTDACAVSDTGGYFVLTTCAGGDDFTPGEYTMYIGDRGGGLLQISRDNNEKEILRLCDDGRIVFSDMATADYGIINGRTLCVWENESVGVQTVIGDAAGIRYDGVRQRVYCLTVSGELYEWGINEKDAVLIDTGAATLCGNAVYDTQGGVIYRKNDGFYLCGGGRTTRFLFDADCTSPEFFFDYSQDYLYYRDTGIIYYVNLRDGANGVKQVCAAQGADSVIFYPDGKCFLAAASDGVLWELGASQKQLGTGASKLSAVENDGGVAYCMDGRLMYMSRGEKTVTLSESVDSFDSIVFSGGRIYWRTTDNNVYRVSEDGSGGENIGRAEYLFFLE